MRARSEREKMSGHVGDLSGSQEEALRQFREAMAGIPNKPEEDDHYYLRWLRARKFNVRKAEEMFRKVKQLVSYDQTQDNAC